MPKTSPVSVRLDPALNAQLDHIATTLDRPKSWVIAEAVREFVAVQEWQLAAIDEGIRQANAGLVVPHEEVMEWVNSWGTAEEKPMPTARQETR